MRRGAAGLAASLGLALALSCAPAALGAVTHAKGGKDVEIPTRVGGAITIAWHGDPAHGCAAAGVCDVSGSLIFTPAEASFDAIKFPNGRIFPGEVFLLGPDSPMIVRVRRDPPGGVPSMCVDALDGPFTLLNSTPLAGGRFQFDFSDMLIAQSDLSAGRCAGPIASDLRGKLPSGVLDVAALRHGSSLLNMSVRKTWSSGPYSGETVSTLGLRVGARSSSDGSDVFIVDRGFSGPPRPPGRRVRVLEVALQYRIAGLEGTLLTSFTGTGLPLCAGLDACGTSGTISYSPSATTAGRLTVGGERRLRPGEHPTQRSALAELRAGRLHTFGFLETSPDALAHVSATVTRSGDATCTDSVTPPFAPFDVAPAGHVLQLRLAKPSGELSADELRTRCPGPNQADALARGPLAAGQIGLRSLGSRRLTVRLSRPGTFASSAYAGARSGVLTLRLVRGQIKERVVRRRVDR